MKRTSLAALTLLATLTALAAPGCSSDAAPDEGGGGTATHSSAGSSTTAGTPPVIIAAGTGNSAAGTASGGMPSAGAPSGGSPAATTGGAATGGGGSGGAPAAGGGGAAAGGAANPGNPGCPEKIDSKLACTQVISCPKSTCGVFKLGSKDCDCAAASGTFTCTSCTYTGTDSIVTPPAAALPACAADDVTLEKNTKGCTKGDRCKSLDTAKSRFCACWDDPVDGGTSWDCDAKPSNWP
jgi:hypothetical protein